LGFPASACRLHSGRLFLDGFTTLVEHHSYGLRRGHAPGDPKKPKSLKEQLDERERERQDKQNRL
jgi:hypothetical protein